MNKQVLTFQKSLEPSEAIPQTISFSLSKYTDSLVVFINQTGAIGSILEGSVVEAAGLTVGEDEEEWSHEEKAPLFEMRVLFGSSEIQFYEVLLRRIMSVIWQEKKVQQRFRVILNVSLPVLSKQFSESAYYASICEAARQGLGAVL